MAFKSKKDIDVKTVKDLKDFLNNLDESYDDLSIVVNIFEGGWVEDFGLGNVWAEGGHILSQEDFDKLLMLKKESCSALAWGVVT